MSAAGPSSDLVKLLPNMSEQLAEIKKQERWRQAVGALVLLGSAVLAMTIEATVAIVFAVLAIAAVWLAPPLRKRLGDKLALKDAAGNVRLFAGETESATPAFVIYDAAGQVRFFAGLGESERPLLAMFDAAQTPRVLLGVATDESPQLSLHDDSATGRVVLSAHSGISGLAVNASDGHSVLELVAPNDNAQVVLKDREGGESHLRAGMLGLQRDERLAGLSVIGESASVSCGAGEHTINCRADQEQAGVIVKTGSNSAVLSATDDAAVIAAVSDDMALRALARPTGVDLQSREGDREWQPLIPPG